MPRSTSSPRSRTTAAWASRAGCCNQALIDARERGLTVSSLQATKMGYPIYERLGYEPICKLEMWERRA